MVLYCIEIYCQNLVFFIGVFIFSKGIDCLVCLGCFDLILYFRCYICGDWGDVNVQ